MTECEAKIIISETTETSELLWTIAVVLDDSIGQCRWLVGRDSTCDIVIPNRYISRKHCTIVKIQNVFGDIVYGVVDGLLGEQSGSRYGIWKHGEKVTSAILKHNDIITIAPTITLKFEYNCEFDKDTDGGKDETNY